MRKIYAVYQDCVLCGDKGRKKVAEWSEKGIDIEKVSFVSELGRELCSKAVNSHGIGGMPFFTDGNSFSLKIDSFLEEEPKNSTKKASATKKNKKSKKGKVNGTVSEV